MSGRRRRARLLRAGILAAMAIALVAAAPQNQQDDRDVTVAEQLLRDGRVQDALDRLSQFEQLHPGSPRLAGALVSAAQLHAVQGAAERAFEIADRVAAEFVGTESAAAATVLRGELILSTARDRDQLRALLPDLTAVGASWPRQQFPGVSSRPGARVIAGLVQARIGEHELANALFVRALEWEPRSAWTVVALVGLGSSTQALGDWQAGARAFQEALDLVVPPGQTNAAAALMGQTRVGIAREDAQARLAAIHRLRLRSAQGIRPWVSARRLPTPGLQLDDPVGIDVDSSDRMVIVDEGVKVAAVFGSSGLLARRTVEKGRRPWLHPSGVAYVPAGRSIVEVGIGASAGAMSGGARPLEEPSAVIVGGSGELLVIDAGSDDVWVLGPVPGTRRGLPGFREPVDIAADSLGRHYVLDKDQRAVVRLGADGSSLGIFASGQWRDPVALDVDALGNVYVLDRRDKTIDVYSPAGAKLVQVGSPLPGGIELRDPRDLAVDRAGRILIVDRGESSVVILE